VGFTRIDDQRRQVAHERIAGGMQTTIAGRGGAKKRSINIPGDNASPFRSATRVVQMPMNNLSDVTCGHRRDARDIDCLSRVQWQRNHFAGCIAENDMSRPCACVIRRHAERYVILKDRLLVQMRFQSKNVMGQK